MNIKQAISRIADLRELIDSAERSRVRADKLENGYPVEVSVNVFVRGCGTTGVKCSRESALSLIDDTIKHYRAEIDHLQPVIDMANAALKGIGA